MLVQESGKEKEATKRGCRKRRRGKDLPYNRGKWREENKTGVFFFFCRNIGGEYCLYISSSSNPMSIMECLTLQKKSAAG